jgi:hypothetical protein
MSRLTIASLFVAMAMGSGAASAQIAEPERPEAQRVRRLPRQHLAGPRFGFTVFTGDVADGRDQMDLDPLMTQFGWQWETQLISQNSGNQVLMEWVLLMGGVEPKPEPPLCRVLPLPGKLTRPVVPWGVPSPPPASMAGGKP